MKARPLALAALVLVAALPSASHAAAVKTVCKLVVDPAGDTTPVAADPVDIVSADIASDARKLTAVIRLKKWADVEPTAPLGRVYQVNFVGKGGTTYAFLSYFITPAGSSYKYGYHDPATNIDTGAGAASGKVVGNDLYMTASVSSLAQLGTGTFKPGARITGIEVHVGRWLGAWATPDVYGGFTNPADTGTADTGYTAGAKSCVKPGA